VKRVIIAGTFAEYGRSADRYELIPPHASLEPTYGYAASKAAASVAVQAFAIEQKMELAYLRIFSAFGEGQYEGNFWPALRKAALAGDDFEMTLGEQIRDYMPVEKVAQSFWNAVTSLDITPGFPYVANVGSGEPTSMKEFAEYWWKQWNASGALNYGALPYREGEVMRFVPQVTPL
jgi:nucleoside-diphosphate-sugar epimerase